MEVVFWGVQHLPKRLPFSTGLCVRVCLGLQEPVGLVWKCISWTPSLQQAPHLSLLRRVLLSRSKKPVGSVTRQTLGWYLESYLFSCWLFPPVLFLCDALLPLPFSGTICPLQIWFFMCYGHSGRLVLTQVEAGGPDAAWDGATLVFLQRCKKTYKAHRQCNSWRL